MMNKLFCTTLIISIGQILRDRIAESEVMNYFKAFDAQCQISSRYTEPSSSPIVSAPKWLLPRTLAHSGFYHLRNKQTNKQQQNAHQGHVRPCFSLERTESEKLNATFR